MSELISRMSPHDLIPMTAIILGIGTGLVVSVTAIIAGSIRRYRERESAINLIHELVARGLPTDEIERLVRLADVETPEKLKMRADRSRP